ncbi:MAG: DUF481 domain-containing protein [Planctomycetota bacterium]|jgi:putative salt-induced outer membrane protein YdiY
MASLLAVRAAIVGLLVTACVSRPVEPDAVVQVAPPPEKRWQPTVTNPKEFDWIKLNTDEWLKGRIKVVREDRIEFRSEKIKNLNFDFEDIKELRSSRTYTVVLTNRETYEGKLIIRDGRLLVGTIGGVREFKREELMAIVPTGQKEWERWSGNLGIGTTIRSGNTDQLDVTSDIRFIRRTAFSKVDLRWIGNFSEVSNVETVNNQRLTGKWDLFVTKKWFVTPISVELFRDPFQNIGLQVTPTAGGGYHLIRQPKQKWALELLAGARFTDSESSVAGADESTTIGAIIPGTSLEWDITSKTELEFAYHVSIGVPDTENTNHYLLTKLSVDVIGDLDLDVTFQWQHIGNPPRASDGSVPFNDDYWLTFGIAWEF